jgi:type I protein arginine methyltransferase
MHKSGYSISDYGGMVRDGVRFTPYVEALRRNITSETVMLDIGAGTGIMSFLAVQLGAKRVYAVEPDVSIEIGKLCAAGIPSADRIIWIRDLSTQIELPEKVDLVVGDLHGVLPFHPGNIPSLADARKRHLKPGGKILPQRDLLYVVPAKSPVEWRTVETPWRTNEFSLNLTPAIPYVVGTWWRAQSNAIKPEQLLATPALWGEVNYQEAESESLSGDLTWTVGREETMDGYYVWFDGVVDDGLEFSNSPLLPELVYGRAFFPLEEQVSVVAGDEVRLRLSVRRMREKFVYRWDTQILASDGTLKASFKQSDFKLMPGQEKELQKTSAEYVPSLNEEGRVEHLILEAMNGTQSSGSIAGALMAAFPRRFSDFDLALAAVSRQAQKYG